MNSKILILNHGLHVSGVSRALVNLANALVNQGHDVTIKLEIDDVTLASELDARVKQELFLKEWHLGRIRIPGFFRYYYRFLQRLYHARPEKLYKRIVKEQYDIEIAFNRGAPARILSGSNNKTAKKLVWVHNDYMLCDNALAGFSSLAEAQEAYKNFDHIVCVSKQAEKAFREKFGDFAGITTKHNIIDRQRILSMAKVDPPTTEAITFCAVGRASPQKNYTMLLDAAHILKQKKHQFSLWIVGDGDPLPALKEYAANLQLDNVTFWGSKTNPYPYLAAADIYVSSSIYEGLSTTTIEALLLNKPCIVTNCTGMKDILGNNEYGLTVPIDATSLADGMGRMLTDANLRQHYTMKAAERAPLYAPELCLADIENLF